MKYIGWSFFFLFLIGLGVGGYFLIKDVSYDPITFKDVKELSYSDINLSDLINQNVSCNSKECTYKKEPLKYTLSEITTLGKQDVTLTIDYQKKEYKHTFKVDVKDTKSPVIKLKEKTIIIYTTSKFDPKTYIESVSDDYSSLAIDDITIDNQVKLKNPGEYEVTYQVSDSSNNNASAKLKVIVKKKSSSSIKPSLDVKPSTTPKPIEITTPPKTEPEKTPVKEPEAEVKPLPLNWEITGSDSVDFTSSLNDKNTSVTLNKEIVLSSFEAEITFASTISGGGGNYKINIMTYDQNDKMISNKKQEFSGSKLTFKYSIEEIGSSTVMIYLVDTLNNKEYIFTLNLNVKAPEKLTDVYLYHEESNGLEVIIPVALGGKNPEFVSTLKSTNDERFPDNLDQFYLEVDKGIAISFKPGCYYEVVVSVTDQEEVITKTITINK